MWVWLAAGTLLILIPLAEGALGLPLALRFAGWGLLGWQALRSRTVAAGLLFFTAPFFDRYGAFPLTFWLKPAHLAFLFALAHIVRDAWRGRIGRRSGWLLAAALGPWLLLALVAALVGLFSEAPVKALRVALNLASSVSMYWGAGLLVRSAEDVKAMALAFLAGAGVRLGVGLVNWAAASGYFGETLQFNNHLGLLAGMSLLLALGLVAVEKRRRLRLAAVVAAGVMLAGLLASLSRTALASSAVGAAVFLAVAFRPSADASLARRYRLAIGVGLAVLAPLTLVAVWQQPMLRQRLVNASLAQYLDWHALYYALFVDPNGGFLGIRMSQVGHTLAQLRRSPLWGLGFVPAAFELHGLFYALLSATGLLGTVFLGLFLVSYVRTLLAARIAGRGRMFIVAGACLACVWALSSVLETLFLQFWIWAALVLPIVYLAHARQGAAGDRAGFYRSQDLARALFALSCLLVVLPRVAPWFRLVGVLAVTLLAANDRARAGEFAAVALAVAVLFLQAPWCYALAAALVALAAWCAARGHVWAERALSAFLLAGNLMFLLFVTNFMRFIVPDLEFRDLLIPARVLGSAVLLVSALSWRRAKDLREAVWTAGSALVGMWFVLMTLPGAPWLVTLGAAGALLAAVRPPRSAAVPWGPRLAVLAVIVAGGAHWAGTFLWPARAQLGPDLRAVASPVARSLDWRKVRDVPSLNPAELYLGENGQLIYRRDVANPPYRDEPRYSLVRPGRGEPETVPLGLQKKFLGWATETDLWVAYLDDTDVVLYHRDPRRGRQREVKRYSIPKAVRRPEVMGYALAPDAGRLLIVDGRMGPYKPFFVGAAPGSASLLRPGVNAAPGASWGGDGWVYFQTAFVGFHEPRIFRVHPESGALEPVAVGRSPLWHGGCLFYIRGEQVYCRSPQGASLKLSGPPVQGFTLRGRTLLAGRGGERGALFQVELPDPAELF